MELFVKLDAFRKRNIIFMNIVLTLPFLTLFTSIHWKLTGFHEVISTYLFMNDSGRVWFQVSRCKYYCWKNSTLNQIQLNNSNSNIFNKKKSFYLSLAHYFRINYYMKEGIIKKYVNKDTSEGAWINHQGGGGGQWNHACGMWMYV